MAEDHTQPPPVGGLSVEFKISTRSDAHRDAALWRRFMDEHGLDFCLFRIVASTSDAGAYHVGVLCSELLSSGLEVVSHSVIHPAFPRLVDGAPIIVTMLVKRDGVQKGKRIIAA